MERYVWSFNGKTMAEDAITPVSTEDGADKPFFEKVKDLFG